jgi:hypothetical protein
MIGDLTGELLQTITTDHYSSHNLQFQAIIGNEGKSLLEMYYQFVGRKHTVAFLLEDVKYPDVFISACILKYALHVHKKTECRNRGHFWTHKRSLKWAYHPSTRVLCSAKLGEDIYTEYH